MKDTYKYFIKTSKVFLDRAGWTQGARVPNNGSLGLLQLGNSLNYTSIRSSAHLAIRLDDSRSQADSEDGTESDVRRVEMGSRIFCLDGLGLFLYEPPLVLSCQGSGGRWAIFDRKTHIAHLCMGHQLSTMMWEHLWSWDKFWIWWCG